MEQVASLARRDGSPEGTAEPPLARRPAVGVRGWPDQLALAVVYLVSVASLVGFATFHLHPELLNRVPGAAAVYGRMFVLAPRVQIALAFLALALFLTRRVGARWLGAFAALYALSLSSELAGTTVGLPFGPYHYTDALGGKLFGHVPLLIPASWFFMALPSYALALRSQPGRARMGRRILVGSLVLLSWDLALDPAMSMVTKYWVWGAEGPYYGMPLLNLAGWYVTGLALMAALAALRADAWVASLPVGWLVAFYGANLLLPLGMSVAAGLWGAVAATAAALIVCWVVTRRREEVDTVRPAAEVRA
ncbi:MAG TPA: carotenoid biosynthesis protein [Gemmatimonadaceae bacterium]|nr:carotenoid biosynthesis protein [Gemmatimonadaceae bacterium]